MLFTLYYPATDDAVSTKANHLWVPKPMALHAEGYARFAHINNAITNSIFTFGLWMLAGSTQIPALVDVPIYPDQANRYHDDSPGHQPNPALNSRFPVIVFSHGMASTGMSYTQYCGELASRGYIVAAIEHRDGSGPGSTVMTADGERNVYHINPANLNREGGIDMPGLKKEQLAFRLAEVEETIRVLRKVDAGNGDVVFTTNQRGEGADLKSWKGRLQMDSVTIAGHSYGATLALQALKNAPSPNLPLTAGIALDPGKSSGPLNDDISVPLLIIHSQSWSSVHSVFFDRPHFDVVREIAELVNHRGHSAWFMTSLGTTHPSVTDAPLIEPFLLSWSTGSTIDVKEGVQEYVKVTDEFERFLKDGERRVILGEGEMSKTFEKEGMLEKLERHGRKIPESVSKYWQVHVAPA